jgi:pimeloyl-ACP methyl ester carboxylesterase
MVTPSLPKSVGREFASFCQLEVDELLSARYCFTADSALLPPPSWPVAGFVYGIITVSGEHSMHPQSHSRIQEGRFVSVRGADQWITIRGDNRRNPAILILPGPGAGMCALAPVFAPWEHRFTLAQWDQPRAGVTGARHSATAPGEYSIARLVRDGITVSEWIGGQLGGCPIALLAFSGGTIVGLQMVKQRPELFSAYIATGQFTHWARQDALSYQMILEQARRSGDHAGTAELEAIGPPPYADTATDAIKSKYSMLYSAADSAAFAELARSSVTDPPADATFVPPKPRPNKDVRAVATAAYDALRAEIVSFDADHLGPEFSVPMIFLQGELDAYAVSSEVERYVARIRAPYKTYISIARAGHSPWMMRDQYLALLQEHVRPILIKPR